MEDGMEKVFNAIIKEIQNIKHILDVPVDIFDDSIMLEIKEYSHLLELQCDNEQKELFDDK
jgi:hypothetical protein